MQAVRWRAREGHDLAAVAVCCNYLVGTLALDLIDAYDSLEWNIGALDTLEFRFQFFFSRVNHDSRAFTENDVFYFKEGIHITLVNLTRMQFVNITLIVNEIR